MEINGADHDFSKMDDVLARRIRAWLNKAAPGVPVMFDVKQKSRTLLLIQKTASKCLPHIALVLV